MHCEQKKRKRKKFSPDRPGIQEKPPWKNGLGDHSKRIFIQAQQDSEDFFFPLKISLKLFLFWFCQAPVVVSPVGSGSCMGLWHMQAVLVRWAWTHGCEALSYMELFLQPWGAYCRVFLLKYPSGWILIFKSSRFKIEHISTSESNSHRSDY